MSKYKFQKPRGMQDILPEEQVFWIDIKSAFSEIASRAGFEMISTPILENAELFTRAVGEQTEVASKEMYTFEDRSSNILALKPESTAGVARAFIENGMASLTKPLKLYYIEPHFRYERPQSGRYRQHHQLGLEIFGDPLVSSDTEVIAMGSRLLDHFGIDHKLSINSLGKVTDRQKYIEALVNYFDKYQNDMDEFHKTQLKQNPLRILDSKDEKITKIAEEAPHILDYLDVKSSKRFQEVLEILEECGIEFELNTRLVRGLDYYNDTVFEYISNSENSRDSLGGGGRYDSLISELGGSDMSAIGLGMGIERIKSELQMSGYIPEKQNVEIFVIAIGKTALPYAEVIREKLLDAGLSVSANFTKRSISDQLAIASKKNAKYAVVIGEREAKEKEVIIKDMASGNQHNEKHEGIVSSLLNALRG